LATGKICPETDLRRANPRFQVEALQRKNVLVATLGDFAAHHRAKSARSHSPGSLVAHPA
jgi:hypothetical protein